MHSEYSLNIRVQSQVSHLFILRFPLFTIDRLVGSYLIFKYVIIEDYVQQLSSLLRFIQFIYLQ